MDNVLSGVRAALASRRITWMAAALALLLSLSALANGLVIDDFFHQHVALEGRGYFADETIHPLDMFAFMSSGDEVRARGMQVGLWPWWISEFHIRFFRPLSAATHIIDYRLLNEHVWLMHLHSGLWYACLAAAAATLFRQVLGTTWCAGLAALLYAIDDRHAGGVGWLASRNMVIAAGATPNGRHRAVRFRFSEPLESPRWRWVAWVGDGYVAFEPPPVGTTNTLPAIDLLDVMSRL